MVDTGRPSGLGDGALPDLRNIDELRWACSDVLETEQANPTYVSWGKNLREFLAEVRAADLQTRAEDPQVEGDGGVHRFEKPEPKH